MKNKNRRKPPQGTERMRRPNRVLLVLVGIVIIAFGLSLFVMPGNKTSVPSSSTKPASTEFVKQGELTFLGPDRQPVITIDIEIADDDASREQGLMYRTTMGENEGMLFVFFEDGFKSFWMKNTVLPLDIMFLNANNEITTIHRNTTPFSEQEYPSSGPARYVIEVVGGFADRHNIEVGSAVEWKRVPAS